MVLRRKRSVIDVKGIEQKITVLACGRQASTVTIKINYLDE
jgi:hypothetical protein